MGLGAAGAGPMRSWREKVEGTAGKGPAGGGFSFREGFECEAEDIGYLPPASTFLFLEGSVGFCGLLGCGKAAASDPGAGPKGLVAALEPFGLLVLGEGQGRCCWRLPLRLRLRL